MTESLDPRRLFQKIFEVKMIHGCFLPLFLADNLFRRDTSSYTKFFVDYTYDDASPVLEQILLP